MCRLRIPGGILTPGSCAASPTLAERFGGGYADVTTRANLQIREIGAADAVDVLTAACRSSASPRAARAPTTSATSPAARPPASTRRS